VNDKETEKSALCSEVGAKREKKEYILTIKHTGIDSHHDLSM
jgi:hypothetical protein